MQNSKPYLLFDLDGTLVDTAPDLVATLNVILERYDLPPQPLDSVKKMIGDGARALLERGFSSSGAPAPDLDALTTEFVEIYVEACTVHSRPFEGVVSVLENFAAAGHKMAVCTNKPQSPSEIILNGLDLMRFFDVVVGSDRLSFRKPHPQHLLGALELMDAAGQPAIMIGDSYNDVASARNAEMPVIVVSFGYTTTPPAELGGDILVDHFTEIPDAVARLSA